MFIVKPEAGCQGKGIFIARTLNELKERVEKNFQRQQREFEQYLKAEENYDTAQKYGKELNQNAQTDSSLNGIEPPAVYYKDHSYVV